jgi:hypothetical protein
MFITIGDVNSNVVTYLHRTVAEFVATAEVWQEVCELTNDMAYESTSSLASACLSMMKLARGHNDGMSQWYLEAAAGFCRKSTSTEPQVIQKYVNEMDSIISEHELLLPHVGNPHWSAKSHWLNLDGIDRAVERYASIHSFAAR